MADHKYIAVTNWQPLQQSTNVFFWIRLNNRLGRCDLHSLTKYFFMKLCVRLLVILACLPLSVTGQQNQSAIERSLSAGTLADARVGFISTYGFSPVDCDEISDGWVCSEFNVSDSTPLSQTQLNTPDIFAAETQTCTAYGSTKDIAQSAFSSQCPWRVRHTCNALSATEWACSTAVIANAVSTPVPALNGEACTAFGSSLYDAQNGFSIHCSWRNRNHCDLLSTGEWACSTEAIATSSEDTFITAPDAASSSTPISQDNVCISYGSSLGEAQAGFSSECPWRDRNHCDPLFNGSWACSTSSITINSNVFDSSSTLPPPTVVTGTGVMNTFYNAGDLIIIAHDSGPDTDDMQAIVANRMIMDAYPNVSFLMVGATQGHAWSNPTDGSVAHTQSLFPDWVDAKASTSGTTSFDGTSVITVANKIGQALNVGGTVHIAEGGPSDFTAQVIRVLQSTGISSAAIKRVRVVQHSAGASAWNQQQTSSANLALVKSAATWVPIANGNVGGNATADFQEPASSALCQRYINAASRTRYASQWAWAFSRIDDSRKCDQSDSVELLYILNETTTKTLDHFSATYM